MPVIIALHLREIMSKLRKKEDFDLYLEKSRLWLEAFEVPWNLAIVC